MKELIKEGVEVLENLTIDVINRVIEHNAKGHELLTSAGTTKEDIEEHHSLLIDIIACIKPAIQVARDFIGSNHPHLLSILNWIEKVYDATLGKLVN